MKYNTKHSFHKTVLAMLLSLFFGANLAYASGAYLESHSSSSANNIPLPQLDSMNQLGKLHFNLPDIQRFQTDNGVAVIFTPLHELPMIDVSVSFLSGSSRDETIKKGAFGIASMTATMLTQGTHQYSEDEFISKIEQLGIRLNASSDKDTLTIHLRSLSDNVIQKEAVQLLLSAITAPTFDEKILARNKLQTITALKRQAQNPDYIAQIAFDKAVFGNHPYAYPTLGTTDSLHKITQDDLHTYKNQYLTANNAKITITGDMNLHDAKALANIIAASLPQGKPVKPLPIPKKAKATHIHIHHPTNQTSIILGHLAEKVNRDELRMQEFSDLRIGNAILAGGDFNARLMDEIREKKGYTYGIYGNFARMTKAGSYTISFSTKDTQSTHAIKDTLQVINQTLQNGIQQDELTLTTQNHKNSFPMVFASNRNIHQTALMLNINDLPLNYLADSLNRYDNATIASVNQTLKKHINPKDFIIVTVGENKPKL